MKNCEGFIVSTLALGRILVFSSYIYTQCTILFYFPITSALKVECEKGPTADSTDAGVHDLDDNTGDYTDEGARSGDSAIFLGCRLPPPRPPRECSSATYKKLDLSTMDVVKPYASLLDTSQRSTNSTNK